MQELAEKLANCDRASELAELRKIYTPENLREATKLLIPAQKIKIKQWILMLNECKQIANVYCDGSGTQKKPGGWGVAIEFDNGTWHEFGGYYPAETTNQQMELLAAINACMWLNSIGVYYKVFILSDSEYTVKGIKYWVKGWQQNGWKNKEGKPVANRQFWEQLASVNKPIFKFEHIPGHNGIEGNERADKIAGHCRKSEQHFGECPYNRNLA